MSSADDFRLRASAGTAAVLRLKDLPAGDVPPTTAYFLVGGRCRRDCGFCPQSHSSAARSDLLSRITWPEADGDAACAAVAGSPVRRVCVQLTDSPEAWTAAMRLLARPLAVPVCISAAGLDTESAVRLLDAGADRVVLPLDAATPEIHAEVKGGPGWAQLRDELSRLAAQVPGRVGTHLVAGLGETERELLMTTASLIQEGVAVGLFAFTPIRGTRLADRPRPSLASYRRVQTGFFLLRTGSVQGKDLRFHFGQLVDPGVGEAELRTVLAGGEAFRTSGCPDCNRPYYNERPGQELYNYPRPLTADEARREIDAVASDLFPRAAPGGSRPAWRLVRSAPGTAAWNMAVDDAMARVHSRGLTPPSLRLYAWQPPAVSVGRSQSPAEEANLEACRREGVEWVKRLTGGGAVLHDDELTYSLVLRASSLPGSVASTYEVLARGLREAMRELGLEPEVVAGAIGLPPGSSACFETPAAHELLLEGRKVVGSAQVRRGGVLLQHGSMLLGFSPERHARFLARADLARLRRRATGIGDAAGRRVTWEEAARAFAAGFARGLDITLVEGSLTPEELRLAGELVEDYRVEAVGDTPVPAGGHGHSH
ncbi:MAG TPA: radical SAM protein [Bacillota bacterium]|nr:radical SAM protein [Bacillota bacterium]